MGRARGQAQAATAVRDFNAVLGARRGSVAAQARRDDEEAHERERIDAIYRETHDQALEAFTTTIMSDSGSRLLVDTLILAYQDGEHDPASEHYEGLIASLVEDAAFNRGTEDIADIAAYGEVPTFPGLTAPATVALGRYLAANPPVKPDDLQWHAERVLARCFAEKRRWTRELAYFERLAPVIDGLAVAVAAQPSQGPQDQPETGLCLHIIRVMLGVSNEVMTGPLACWAHAIAQRFDDGKLDFHERGEDLRTLVYMHRNTPAAAVVAPISQRLGWDK